VSLPDAYRQDFIDAVDIVFFSAAHHADPAALMREMGRGPRNKIVIVGMGSRGCAVVTGQTVRRFAAVPGDSPIVDTNGAGDGLAVGFLSSFVLDGYALEDAIRRGQIVARYTCTQKASSSHLMAQDMLDEQWHRLKHPRAVR
jgi:sugar/nucleoside kinase (ribokinase family)